MNDLLFAEGSGETKRANPPPREQKPLPDATKPPHPVEQAIAQGLAVLRAKWHLEHLYVQADPQVTRVVLCRGRTQDCRASRKVDIELRPSFSANPDENKVFRSAQPFSTVDGAWTALSFYGNELVGEAELAPTSDATP